MWWLKEDILILKKNINCNDLEEIINYYKFKSKDLSSLNKIYKERCEKNVEKKIDEKINQ